MASYNRVNGRTGHTVRIEVPAPQIVNAPVSGAADSPHTQARTRQTAARRPGTGKGPLSALSGIGGELGGFFQRLGLNFSLAELETEDYILMLILFLMYRESGDTELLIALGAMLLT